MLSSVLPALMPGNAGRAGAQELYRRLLGSVGDPTGAAIPNATNQGARQRWTTAADPPGASALSSLPPATYEVAIGAQGFRTFKRPNISLPAGATVRVDAAPEAGRRTEEP